MSEHVMLFLSRTIQVLNNELSDHVIKIEGMVAEERKKREDLIISLISPQAQEGKASSIAKKTGKIAVKVKIMLQKIGAIDTLKDRYSADIVLTTKWREPTLDGKKKELKTINWNNIWTPKMVVSNVIGDVKIMTSYSAQYDSSQRALAIETKKFSGQFYESMELYDFPFDKQDLTVVAMSELTVDEIELAEDEKDPCGLNIRAFSAEQEWAISQHLKKWSKTVTKKVNEVKEKHPAFCVAAKATRRPQFFIFNVIIILMALCSLCFASFAVSQELTPNRLQLTFTLILTCVTFKFVVSKTLPKISYLTCVDKYILGSMIILIGICYWHAISGGLIYIIYPKAGHVNTATFFNISQQDSTTAVAFLAKENRTTKGCPSPTPPLSKKPGAEAVLIDKYAMAFFSSVYILFNATFLFKVLIGYCKKDEDGGGDEDEEDD